MEGTVNWAGGPQHRGQVPPDSLCKLSIAKETTSGAEIGSRPLRLKKKKSWSERSKYNVHAALTRNGAQQKIGGTLPKKGH